MYVKMMGYRPVHLDGEPPWTPQPFRIFQAVQDVNITHAFHDNVLLPNVFKLEVTFEDGIRVTVDVLGPVYILNDQGKTIESFEVSQVAPLVPWQHPGAALNVPGIAWPSRPSTGPLPSPESPAYKPSSVEVARVQEQLDTLAVEDLPPAPDLCQRGREIENPRRAFWDLKPSELPDAPMVAACDMRRAENPALCKCPDAVTPYSPGGGCLHQVPARDCPDRSDPEGGIPGRV